VFIFVNTSFSFIPSIKLSIRSSTWFIYDDRSPPDVLPERGQTPQYYFEFGKFAIMRRNLSIFISIKLPITPHNVRYKVFKILAFPVPVNESITYFLNLFLIIQK
jgi:hypothetical protein